MTEAHRSRPEPNTALSARLARGKGEPHRRTHCCARLPARPRRKRRTQMLQLYDSRERENPQPHALFNACAATLKNPTVAGRLPQDF